MQVNNIRVTGECKDLKRDATEREENIFESPNVAFFGTECTAGSGTGVVFRTGDGTVLGKCGGSLDTTEIQLAKWPPLLAEIYTFGYWCTLVALVLGVLISLFSGNTLFDSLVLISILIITSQPTSIMLVMVIM